MQLQDQETEEVGLAMGKKGERGAIILAGGDGKRLGRPKPFLELAGETLIGRIIELLCPLFPSITVVADRVDCFKHLPVHLTSDLLDQYQKTPLRGIHAGLSLLPLPYQFVTACDMPFLNRGLIEYMSRFAPDYDVVVPRIGFHYQPLHAFYSRNCREIIAAELSQGSRKVTNFFSRVRVKEINEAEISRFDPQQNSFFNINTRSDHAAALGLLRNLSRSS